MTELVIKNLFVNYDNRDILSDVSISFNKGLNYLIGLNGCGKTSFLNSIVGLVKYRGEISWNAQELSALSARERAQRIALLTQRLQLPFRTQVFDFVLMGRFPYLNWLGNYDHSDREAAEQALEKMDLQDFRHRSMNELSGGEFQRANLARALCQNSPVLLLDEPAQSLDPRSKTFLYDLLEKLAEDHLLICVTHDLDYLREKNTRIVGLHEGQVIWDENGIAEMEELKARVYGIAKN